LQSRPPAGIPSAGNHARASTRFLTDVPPKLTQSSELQAGTSMDQFAAQVLGQETQLKSLELGLDSRDWAGSCDVGFSCAYTNTISWKNPTTPLPVENDPRGVFERLFGDGGTTDPAARLARIRDDRSVLDVVTGQIRRLQQGLASRDRAKIDQYVEAIRDIERRIQMAEDQSARELPLVEQPAGVPPTFEEHAKLMLDLQVLAYQSDLTRVTTFMFGRELSGRPYPELGVNDAHHPTSHHQNDPVKLANLTKINTFHMKLFAYYVDKLKATPDGDGSLLDHVLLMYGAGMSDSQQHAYVNVPVMLLGGAELFKGGRHVKYAETPLANLHVTLLSKLGVRAVDKIGDSTGQLDYLSLS
jgi:hypothetical protein